MRTARNRAEWKSIVADVVIRSTRRRNWTLKKIFATTSNYNRVFQTIRKKSAKISPTHQIRRRAKFHRGHESRPLAAKSATVRRADHERTQHLPQSRRFPSGLAKSWTQANCLYLAKTNRNLCQEEPPCERYYNTKSKVDQLSNIVKWKES